MESLDFEMTSWQLNQVYEKIENCRVVRPPYDIDGFYSAEFYLDKRFPLKEKYEDVAKTFIDYIDIAWDNWIIRYYYYTKTFEWYTTWYIWAIENWAFRIITPTWFLLSENSPRKLCYWRWVRWPVWWSITFTEYKLVDWDPSFKYTWTSLTVWDFIIFNTAWDNLLWVISKVTLIDWDWYVHLNATDVAVSRIVVWTTALRYDWDTTKISQSIVVWHTDLNWYWNISTVILNWYSEWNVLNLKKYIDDDIIDIINFDWNIFALTEYKLFFSNFLAYSNLSFWLNAYDVDWWEKLFDLWEVILLFARKNKLYTSANTTNTSADVRLWYVWYDANYNWNLFSKYSMIFADQTIYILQDDAQLMQVDIKKTNQTTYELNVKNVLLNSRWIFESFKWWEIAIHSSNKYLNFIYRNLWNTTNYQFDKQYQHWLINSYIWKEIYRIEDEWDVLSQWKIYTEDSSLDAVYTDDWTEYYQSVNFAIKWWKRIYMPYTIRTMFWIKQWDEILPKVDVDLIVNFDIWWKNKVLNIKLNNFWFDSRLNLETLWLDEIVWYDSLPWEVSEYDWTIVSLQSNIQKTWRFIRFKYTSVNRFCIWPSYILADYTKPFINEVSCTN